MVTASTVEELEGVEVEGKILLLYGEITQEQLMPKNFTFYNPEHHQKMVALLEAKNPAAILTATGRNPELAGGMYPFPMLEDGDFDIPSVYMKDVDGEQLVKHADEEVSLEIDAQRIPSTGCNVIARKGKNIEKRIVLCAHIDAKDNTPGALDNGTGIVALLILAELLDHHFPKHKIEIVALNGEDHYSAQGQKEYIQNNQGKFEQIMVAINTDVAGYKKGKTVYSLYGCPEEIARAVYAALSRHQGMEEGEQWYQSDHSIFTQNQRPAIAFTSDQFMELSTNITHTPKDNPDLVDYEKLVDVALALRDLIFFLT
jgi:aminopeptidase YwaD